MIKRSSTIILCIIICLSLALFQGCEKGVKTGKTVGTPPDLRGTPGIWTTPEPTPECRGDSDCPKWESYCQSQTESIIIAYPCIHNKCETVSRSWPCDYGCDESSGRCKSRPVASATPI